MHVTVPPALWVLISTRCVVVLFLVVSIVTSQPAQAARVSGLQYDIFWAQSTAAARLLNRVRHLVRGEPCAEANAGRQVDFVPYRDRVRAATSRDAALALEENVAHAAPVNAR